MLERVPAQNRVLKLDNCLPSTSPAATMAVANHSDRHYIERSSRYSNDIEIGINNFPSPLALMENVMRELLDR